MIRKPAKLYYAIFGRKIMTVGVLASLLAQSSFLPNVYPESALDETAPIELSPSSDELELSTTETISMSFDGALLKDVLLLFSQQSGLNFVASQDTENKKVTVYFENVSPKDALDSIITANGLSYSKKPGSDIYIVTQLSKAKVEGLVTKVIRLKFMRLSSSPLDVGGQVTINNLAQTSGSEGSGSSGGSSSLSSDRGADKLAQRLLSPQGKLTTDLHTNSLIIMDTAKNIAEIEKVLAELDVPPMQVVLEVHIMEISSTLSKNIGIEWGGDTGALATLTGGVKTTKFPFNPGFFKNRINADSTIRSGELETSDGITTVTANNASTAPQVQYGLLNANNFSATLHYILNDSDTKTLARPKILTQNNEAAEIKLVSNQAIASITKTSDTAGSATETTEPERVDVGVTMRITPQINSDDTVLLFLEPAYSTANQSAFFPDFVDPTTRSLRTMARVKDNQTLVIGGFIEGGNDKNVQKMPLLGDLPIIGKVFRYDSSRDIRRELIVFITPHIVRGSSSLGRNSATAQGEDTDLARVMSKFMDNEMDVFANNFENALDKKDAFFTKDQEFIRASEFKSANPAVEQQMNYALDSMAPQLVDQKITQAMDSLTPKKRG